MTVHQIASIRSASCDVSQLDLATDDGRTFRIPPIGMVLSSSALAAGDNPELDDIEVLHSKSGELAARIGNEFFGSESAKAALESRASSTRGAPDTLPDQHEGHEEADFAVMAIDKCTDNSWARLVQGKWLSGYPWFYNPSGEPSSTTRSVMRSAGAAWRTGTACGNSIYTSANDTDSGLTTQRPAVTEQGGCGAYNSSPSVVGWGVISNANNSLAISCVWSDATVGGRIYKADQNYNVLHSWTTTDTCSGYQFDVKSVAVHEFGHAYGLHHVAEDSGLVMRPRLAACAMDPRTIGLGDRTGIQTIYPRP